MQELVLLLVSKCFFSTEITQPQPQPKKSNGKNLTAEKNLSQLISRLS